MEKYKLGKTKIAMPSGWHEVPFKTGVELLENPEATPAEIMVLLSGVDIKTIRKATDKETLFYFVSAFEFIKTMPRNIENPQIPRSMKFRGDRLVFPYVMHGDLFDLGKTEVGQIEDMVATIKTMSKEFIGEVEPDEESRAITENEQLKMVPFIVAIYLQKLINKEYDYDAAMRLVKDVEQASFKDVANIGYFFFLRLIALTSGSMNGQLKPNSIQRKLKRGFWTLIKRLGLSLP